MLKNTSWRNQGHILIIDSQWPPASGTIGAQRVDLKPKTSPEGLPLPNYVPTQSFTRRIKYNHYLSNAHMQIILNRVMGRKGRKGSFKNLLVTLVCIWIGLGLGDLALSRYGFVINIVGVLLRMRPELISYVILWLVLRFNPRTDVDRYCICVTDGHKETGINKI